jgi:hypothetical protein
LPLPDNACYLGWIDLIAAIKKEIKTPVLLEPAILHDFSAEVEGIIYHSPATKSGLKPEDVILKVNYKPVFSRVDAFYKILSAKNPRIDLKRNQSVISVNMVKEKDMASGLVFHYDMHPDTIIEIEKVIKRNKNKRLLLLTSELAYPMMIQCTPKNDWIRIDKVENTFFGGNIGCAGLLTISDIIEHLSQLKKLPDVILLPSIMFDASGKDLTGVHYMHLEELFEIKIEVI